MLVLWGMVGHGEVVDADKNLVNWSIDWLALQTLMLVEHELVTSDPGDEIVEGLLAIRSELMRPPADALLAHPLDY